MKNRNELDECVVVPRFKIWQKVYILGGHNEYFVKEIRVTMGLNSYTQYYIQDAGYVSHDVEEHELYTTREEAELAGKGGIKV